MKITGRQKAFLNTLLDLYREVQGPLHYTTLAERLEVSKITAYDMLRLLEKRGLVQSKYVLRGKGQGAGRSSIVFWPTPKAHALFTELAGEAGDLEQWETAKARILDALEAGKGGDYHDLLKEILARLPERQSPLLYAAEMVTAVVLSLQQLREEASTSSLCERLRPLGLPEEVGLSALGGLAVGLSFAERANRRLTNLLLSHVTRYQQVVSHLSAENLRRLADFAGEVMRIVET